MNRKKGSIGAPGAFISDMIENRSIIRRLVWQEIQTRHRGSLLGILWYFVTPFLLLTIYGFVFSVIFKARWTDAPQSNGEFALTLFSGMIVFTIINECLTRAPNLIVNNSVFVKKVVFPLEILPATVIGVAIFNAAISLVAYFVFYAIIIGPPPLSAFWFVPILVPIVLLCLGITWILSALGVYLRDLSHVIGIFSTALTLLSPLFYPLDAIPASYRWLAYLNPLTFLLEETRKVLCWGGSPDFESLITFTAIAWAIAWLGYVWFIKTKRGFADVL